MSSAVAQDGEDHERDAHATVSLDLVMAGVWINGVLTLVARRAVDGDDVWRWN
jgi:hypothetical protein